MLPGLLERAFERLLDPAELHIGGEDEQLDLGRASRSSLLLPHDGI